MKKVVKITYRILITKKNNPMGIKIFPNSDPIYENVFDFPNDTNDGQDLTKRDDFVVRALFDIHNGTLLKNLVVEKGIVIKQIVTDLNSISFSIKYDDFIKWYPDQTHKDFKNKDYAVLQISILFDDSSTEDTHYFYQILLASFSPSDVGDFNFAGELDLYTTFPGDITFEEKVYVSRSHVDRVKMVEGTLEYIYDENTLQPEEKFASLEPGYVNKEKTQKIETFITNAETPAAQEWARSLKWAIVYVEDSNNTNNTKIIYRNEKDWIVQDIENKMLLNCNILIFPINNYVKICYEGDPLNIKTWGGLPAQEKALGDSKVAAVHIVDNLPFNPSYYFFQVRIDQSGFLVFTLRLEDRFQEFLENIYMMHIKDLVITSENTLRPVQKPYKPVLKNDSDQRDILNEVKIFSSYHTWYVITNINTEEAKFAPEWLEDNSQDKNFFKEIYMCYSFSADKLNLYYTFQEKNNYNLMSGKGSIQADLIELPLAKNPIDSYLTQNKVSSKSSVLTGSAWMLGGFGAAIAGAGKNRRMTNFGIFGMLSGGRKVGNEYANRGDLERAPKQAKNVTSSSTFYVTSGELTRATLFTVLELTPAEKKIVFDYYTMCGYSQNMLRDLNKDKLSRERFNYIEADNVFNHISKNLATSLKQQVDRDFENAIRFWHYRSYESFKGFMNFEIENREMSLLTFNKETKKWELKEKEKNIEIKQIEPIKNTLKIPKRKRKLKK